MQLLIALSWQYFQLSFNSVQCWALAAWIIFFFAVPEVINSIKIQSWDCSEKQDQICKYSIWPVLQGWTWSILLENCGSSCLSVISEQLLSWCPKQFASHVSSYFIKQGLRKERKSRRGTAKTLTTGSYYFDILHFNYCEEVKKKKLSAGLNVFSSKLSFLLTLFL